MATTEAAPEIDAHDDHGHDHDHPEWLAHHFDTPEQQFDSGKLGIWLFLVTEVLFFSGMFCAYAIFRMLRPDVFEGCSQFLNTKLGAINTGVLLFSSLTMAWAVRCSQTENQKGLVGLLAATLSCAMIFLGVKAIEYSHKWEMGLLPAGLFSYNPAEPHPPGSPPYLLYICLPFAIALVGVVIWLIVSLTSGNRFQAAVAKPLTVVCLCFFVGVGLGTQLESGSAEGHASHSEEHAGEEHGSGGHGNDEHAAGENGDHGDAEHADGEHVADTETEAVATSAGESESAAGDAAKPSVVDADTLDIDAALQGMLATEQTNSGIQSELAARQRQTATAGGAIVYDREKVEGGISQVSEQVMTPSRAGVFFSIYYCMTGVHAIHILGGIAVLVWLLFRAVRNDFNRQYFGPVDYVGLYWHLVDLIWIYLFPLMYLIR